MSCVSCVSCVRVRLITGEHAQVAAKKINLVEAGAPQGDISEKFQDLRREVMLMRHASRPSPQSPPPRRNSKYASSTTTVA